MEKAKFSSALSYLFFSILISGAITLIIFNSVTASTPEIFYSQPIDNNSAPYQNFGGGFGNPLMAETFLTSNSGFLTEVKLYVRYVNCHRPVRASILNLSPDNVNGLPLDVVTVSLDNPSFSSFYSFSPITWHFDGITILEANKFYALQLEWLDPGVNCRAFFLGNGDLTDSKIYIGGAPWTFLTNDDLKMEVRGSKSVIRNLTQLKADDSTPIIEGDTLRDPPVQFSAQLFNSLDNNVKLQVEIRNLEEPFTGIFDGGIIEGGFVPAGSSASVVKTDFPDSPYHWRARAIDVEGNFSEWLEFGTSGDADFFVDAVIEFGPDILYEQPLDFGGPPAPASGVSNFYQPVIASTFLTGKAGFADSARLHVKYANCRRPIRARISTLSPPGPNGLPDAVIVTSLNAPNSNDSGFGNFTQFAPITWNFDGTAFLEKDTYFALELASEDLSGNCFADFLGDGNVASSTIYKQISTNPDWQLVTHNDFRMTIGGREVHDIDIAVILAELSDTPHASSSIMAQPCKLIPAKTYPNGRDKSYYEDLAFCVEDYHRENSFGIVDLDFEIFDNGGDWFRLTSSTAAYSVGTENLFVRDAVNESGLDLTGFDIIAVIHAGDESIFRNLTWPHQFQPFIGGPFAFIASEINFTGTWAHEIGHLMGELVILPPDNTIVPDFYPFERHSNVALGPWDIMGGGSRHSGGRNPPFMSSYVKEYLKWLTYEGGIHAKSEFREHEIISLESQNFGDSVFRYNLENSTSTAAQQYYILEARNRNLKTWDSSLPEEKALVLYYVDEAGLPKYGYNASGTAVSERRTVIVPTSTNLSEDGVLIPASVDKYDDWDHTVRFIAKSDTFNDGKYQITAKIETLTGDFLPQPFAGTILQPNNLFAQKIFSTELVEGDTLLNKAFATEYIEPQYGIITAKVLEIDPNDPNIKAAVDIDNLGGVFRLEILKVEPIDAKNPMAIVGRGGVIYARVNTLFSDTFMPGDVIRGVLRYESADWIPPFLSFYLSDASVVSRTEKEFLNTQIIILLLLSLIIAGLAIIFVISRRRIFIIAVIIFFVGVAIVVIKFLGSGSESHSDSNTARGVDEMPLTLPTAPDLDLHVITSDGKHAGLNYQTGEYESEIPGVIASGDNSASHEWILVPTDTEATFYVSSKDNQIFLDKNPDIAGQLTDLSDSYDIYARFIDPNAGIFTSAMLENQLINPGETISHQLSGTSTIAVAPGAERTISASIKITPKTFDLKSKGILTVFIEIPDDFGLTLDDIDISSLKLEGVPPINVRLADRKHLIAEFQREDFTNLLPSGNNRLTLTGFFFDGTPLKGADAIRTISANSDFQKLSSLLANLSAILRQILELLTR